MHVLALLPSRSVMKRTLLILWLTLVAPASYAVEGGGEAFKGQPIWMSVIGLIVAGFLGEVGKLLLKQILKWFKSVLLPAVQSKSASSLTQIAVLTLLQMGFWLAMFGIIASVAFGIAGVSLRDDVRQWCYAVGNGSHVVANIFVAVLALRTLMRLPQEKH
jgi:hypothetical protein